MKRDLVFKVILGFWIGIIILVFFSSVENQIIIPKSVKKNLNYIFPEGWGFFTKNPRDPLLDVYRINKNKIFKINFKNQTYDNYFGLSRSARIKGYEASMIANQIPPSFWQIDTTKNLNYLPKKKEFQLDKTEFKYLNYGKYLLVLYDPIPFYWSDKNQEPYNPIKYSVVNIKN